MSESKINNQIKRAKRISNRIIKKINTVKRKRARIKPVTNGMMVKRVAFNRPVRRNIQTTYNQETERKWEGVCQLTATTTFGYDFYNLCGYGAEGKETFPWFYKQMESHAEFRIDDIEFVYKPSADLTRSGDVCMCYQPDYLGVVPETLGDGLQFGKHANAGIKDEIHLHLTKRELGPRFKTFSQLNELGGHGYVYIGYSASTAGPIGTLQWKCKITCRNPVSPSVASSTTFWFNNVHPASPSNAWVPFSKHQDSSTTNTEETPEGTQLNGTCFGQPAGICAPTTQSVNWFETVNHYWAHYAQPGNYFYHITGLMNEATSAITNLAINVQAGAATLEQTNVIISGFWYSVTLLISVTSAAIYYITGTLGASITQYTNHIKFTGYVWPRRVPRSPSSHLFNHNTWLRFPIDGRYTKPLATTVDEKNEVVIQTVLCKKNNVVPENALCSNTNIVDDYTEVKQYDAKVISSTSALKRK